MAMEQIREMAQSARQAGLLLSATTLEQRNQALIAIGESLERHISEIIEANERDLRKAKEENLSTPMVNRRCR